MQRVQLGAGGARAHHGAQLVAHVLRRAARRARHRAGRASRACASIGTVSGRREPRSTSVRRIAHSVASQTDPDIRDVKLAKSSPVGAIYNCECYKYTSGSTFAIRQKRETCTTIGKKITIISLRKLPITLPFSLVPRPPKNRGVEGKKIVRLYAYIHT